MVFITDIPGLVLDGETFAGARGLIWITDTAYWLVHASYGWFWMMFIDYRLFGSSADLKKRVPLYALPMLAEVLLIILNPVTGWIFRIDNANSYTPGSAYYENLIPYFIYTAAAVAITVYGYYKKRDREQLGRCLPLAVFMLFPICGIVLEIFAYGVTWVWPLTALSLLMIYVNTKQQRLSEEYLREAQERVKCAGLERELIDSRITSMLSQIQPHFLYNSLAAIQALCTEEPGKAKDAVKRFSDYLRVNMDSLTMDKPISFELELSHTENYLALEKLRFEDAVNIEYDIKTTMFRLPTLTLQPLVENAVHHGITRREGGGTVRITSKETERAFVITVEDNGVGFDPGAPTDGKVHIGIANVRSRLTDMCGGRLEITSTPGLGTTAIISIPKGGDCYE